MLDDIVIIMKKAKLIDLVPQFFLAQVYEELGQMLSPALGFLPIFIKHFKIVSCINSEFYPYWHYHHFVIIYHYDLKVSLFCHHRVNIGGEEDERTEILLAATFLLIVILAFIGCVPPTFSLVLRV